MPPSLVLLALTLGLKAAGFTSRQDQAPVVSTERFELRSDPQVALHHLLIDWASADSGQWPPFALRLAPCAEGRSALDA